MTAMIASEMPAAMRPYSIAVAPVSSAMNFIQHDFHRNGFLRGLGSVTPRRTRKLHAKPAPNILNMLDG